MELRHLFDIPHYAPEYHFLCLFLQYKINMKVLLEFSHDRLNLI